MFAGDTGLLFSIDRDWITAKKENSKVVLKNRDPKKVDKDDNKGPVVADSDGILSFEYGFFLPCSWAETGLSDEDGVVIKSLIKNGKEIRIDSDRILVSAANNDIAVAIHDNGVDLRVVDDKYTISKDGISYEGNKGRLIDFVTDVRYDKESHQIQKKTITLKKHGTFLVDVGTESDWGMIDGGQAEPIPEE
jgi:hypothetical protein